MFAVTGLAMETDVTISEKPNKGKERQGKL